jgi:hypothetical protein
VLADDREQVAEELAVLLGEALGDLVQRGSLNGLPGPCADPSVPASIRRRRGVGLI